jgi:dolichyl-phosphate-mannose--protein O-mannosyl transferase
MSSGLIIALEFTLVLGVVIGLAVWELWRLRRDLKKPPD